MHRRACLQAITATAFGAIVEDWLSAAEKSGIVIDDLRTISWNAPLYHGWPTLARRKSGELLLAFSGGREAHVCPFGRLELMRSKDNGKTWGWPQVIYDGPIDDRDAGIVETPKGALLLTNFTSMDHVGQLERLEKGLAKGFDPKMLVEWQAAHYRLTKEERQRELGVWMWRSTDGGITWSARYAAPCNSPHGPIALKDGRLLYPGIDLWAKAPIVGVWESTDDGLTWKLLKKLPIRPGDDPKNYHELHAVEATNGTIILHIRNHNLRNEGETLQTESTDGGRSWSTPHSIGVWGLPSHLLRLKDGRLLMSYGYRRKPFGNQVRISSDHGRTWSDSLTISDDGHGVDLGYPSTIECDNGSFVTVWYEVMKGSPKAQLRQARWRLK